MRVREREGEQCNALSLVRVPISACVSHAVTSGCPLMALLLCGDPLGETKKEHCLTSKRWTSVCEMAGGHSGKKEQKEEQ